MVVEKLIGPPSRFGVPIEICAPRMKGARAHEIVDVAVLEGDEDVRHHVRHDVFAQLPARISETVGEFLRLGQQQEARVVVNEGRQDHEIGLDRVVGAVGSVIRDSGHASARC